MRARARARAKAVKDGSRVYGFYIEAVKLIDEKPKKFHYLVTGNKCLEWTNPSDSLAMTEIDFSTLEMSFDDGQTWKTADYMQLVLKMYNKFSEDT